MFGVIKRVIRAIRGEVEMNGFHVWDSTRKLWFWWDGKRYTFWWDANSSKWIDY